MFFLLAGDIEQTLDEFVRLKGSVPFHFEGANDNEGPVAPEPFSKAGVEAMKATKPSFFSVVILSHKTRKERKFRVKLCVSVGAFCAILTMVALKWLK